jgi:hypothetical protein
MISKAAQFQKTYHAVFGRGLLLKRRISESGSDVCDCLFLSGTAPRTILTSALILFVETRTANLAERKAISRWLASRSLARSKVIEPEPDDFQIPNSDPSGTLTEVEPEQEQVLTA